MDSEWQSISIMGKVKTGDENEAGTDKYWLTLGRSGWIGGEPGNNSKKVLSATNGSWKYETSTSTGAGTFCRAAGNSLVIQFMALNPDTVQVGSKGTGHAEGTGREIEWTVQSL